MASAIGRLGNPNSSAAQVEADTALVNQEAPAVKASILSQARTYFTRWKPNFTSGTKRAGEGSLDLLQQRLARARQPEQPSGSTTGFHDDLESGRVSRRGPSFNPNQYDNGGEGPSSRQQPIELARRPAPSIASVNSGSVAGSSGRTPQAGVLKDNPRTAIHGPTSTGEYYRYNSENQKRSVKKDDIHFGVVGVLKDGTLCYGPTEAGQYYRYSPDKKTQRQGERHSFCGIVHANRTVWLWRWL